MKETMTQTMLGIAVGSLTTMTSNSMWKSTLRGTAMSGHLPNKRSVENHGEENERGNHAEPDDRDQQLGATMK